MVTIFNLACLRCRPTHSKKDPEMSPEPTTTLPVRSLLNELFPGSRDSETAIRIKDGLAIALAMLLPVSTSAVGVLAIMFALALLPTFNRAAFVLALKSPASITALLLFTLAVLGALGNRHLMGGARARRKSASQAPRDPAVALSLHAIGPGHVGADRLRGDLYRVAAMVVAKLA